MDESEVKTITKGAEDHGPIPGESWYGWMVINIPTEWTEQEEWEYAGEFTA